MNNEQPKKLYRLIEGNMEAVAYVTYLAEMVIDEELYKALPNRLKKAFTGIMPKETINPKNMSEEIQNGAEESTQDEQVVETTPVEEVVATASENADEIVEEITE